MNTQVIGQLIKSGRATVSSLCAGLLFVAALGWPDRLAAFEFNGSKWPGAQTDFYVGIDGSAPSGLFWNAAFIAAMEEWNSNTDFSFNLVGQTLDPCAQDNLNGTGFTDDVCGTEYGENTLAVTVRRFVTSVLGPPVPVSSDIVFNSFEAREEGDRFSYDIFDGDLVQFGTDFNGRVIDFRRVALHELGHALGLEHEENRSIAAIMAPRIGNLDRLQQDDIDGANMLYGGPRNCLIQPLRFGSTAASLGAGDCTVIDLTVGGDDDSFIDVYSFELEARTNVSFSMNSSELDSVLLLSTPDLEYLDFDVDGFGECSSSLSSSLEAGSYFLLANTFVDPPEPNCSNTGSYRIEASFETANLKNLGTVGSLLGNTAEARFSGGATANDGRTYGNRFSPLDRIDVDASIEIDPLHVGRVGFLVAAAFLGDQVLMLDALGNFVPVDPAAVAAGDFPVARNGILRATESLKLLSGIVPGQLGVSTADIDFLVGYGVSSLPGDVFFPRKPINLRITE